MNDCWLITTATIFTHLILLIFSYLQVGFGPLVLIFQYLLTALIFSFVAFHTERAFKESFVQSLENQRMHK